MKPILWILFIAAIVYGANNYALPYLMSQGASTQAAAQNPTTPSATASINPQPAPAPLPTPAPNVATPTPTNALVAAPPQPVNPPKPAAAAPVHMICATNVAAFDPNSPVEQLGWFEAGSELEVSDCPKITGMKNVAFKDTSGQIVHAVCFEKDLNRTTEPAAATTTENKPVVEMPKPLTIKRKSWAGEPNWRSVYDDPGHHMMTDKNGNQK